MTMITPPKPGRHVLACRCGRPLDLKAMRRLTLPDRPNVIAPIVCAGCVRNRSW